VLDRVIFRDYVNVCLRAEHLLDSVALEVLDLNWSLVHRQSGVRIRAVILDIAPHIDATGLARDADTEVIAGDDLVETLALLQ